MRALVTGCAGFIGSHLTEALLRRGYAVTGVDCFNRNYARDAKLTNLKRALEWSQFEFLPLDLSRGELEDVVEGCEVIYHLAAEPGVRASWGARFEHYVRNNVIATQTLLEAACREPEIRFVYASSSSIYGDARGKKPLAEDARPVPRSPYGVTKLAAEHLCDLYRENHGVRTTTLRYFTVYGPRQRPDMAFQRFITAALTRSPIEIYGDGSQRREFTYVEDVVSATLNAGRLDGLEGEVFNIGGGAEHSLSAALQLIMELVGHELEIRYAGEQPGDVQETRADTTRARARLGFEPKTTLADGLSAQIAWLTEAPRLDVRKGPVNA